MDATVLRSLLLTTIGMVFVLLARRPLRRAFGADPAFLLWLLPPLLASLPWLPATPIPWITLPALQVFPGPATDLATPLQQRSVAPWLYPAWLTGTAMCLLRLLVQLVRLHRQSRRAPESMLAALRQDMKTLDSSRLRLHPAGPALLPSAGRTLLLLPADFMQRFSAAERRLILRHELVHLRRGDVMWNLFAEVASALLWFHPLAWLALPRFRLDQELACDARVLRLAPQHESAYANVLMHSVGSSLVPALIPWLAEPQLKERLIMIQRHRPGVLRRCIGYFGLAALLAGSALVVQAQSTPSSDQSASSDLAHNQTMQPRYPAASIKNHEQGTVVLKILVHADGTVGSITYDPQYSSTVSGDLIAAATNAARQWRFNPQMKDGKPIEGYARVPVKFMLAPLTDGTAKDEAKKRNAKS